jgi:hypothetical protein
MMSRLHIISCSLAWLLLCGTSDRDGGAGHDINDRRGGQRGISDRSGGGFVFASPTPVVVDVVFVVVVVFVFVFVFVFIFT